MTIFDVLTMIGGLCLFLFGMSVMGDALERRAGNGLKALLGKLTNSKLKGFLTGLGVTAVIQSSSATTVMVVGFVNSRVMTLRQSMGVIMGANLGTTVTAWVLSLGGISSDNVFLKLLKPTSFTPILALIGTVLFMSAKADRRKDTGTILLGFATLMFGMDTMSGAVSGLADIPAFQNLFLAFENPILGVLVGAALTAAIQSSSASVGILQALSATGAVSYAAAVPIIMGQNIGTCVTALLSSFGTNKNAKRAAVIHLSFNVIGAVIWLSVFTVISAALRPAILGAPATYLGIAVAHSVFNLLCTALLLPMSSVLEKIAYIVVPEREEEVEKFVELDERLLVTPTIALQQCRKVVLKMAAEAMEGFKLSLDALEKCDLSASGRIRKIEDNTDRYEDIVGTYLTKLGRSRVSGQDSAAVSMLLKAIGDFERIADHSVNVLESVEELCEKKISFSADAQKELSVISAALTEVLELTLGAFEANDPAAAARIEPIEQVVDDLREALRTTHVERLQSGACTVEAGFIWADLLISFERTSDHCSNVAVGVIEAARCNMNAHESIRRVKAGDERFVKEYEAFSQKYSLSE